MMVSVIASMVTRQKVFVAFITTVIAGAILGAAESLRHGIIPSYIEAGNSLVFALGALCICGIFAIVNELREYAISKNT